MVQELYINITGSLPVPADVFESADAISAVKRQVGDLMAFIAANPGVIEFKVERGLREAQGRRRTPAEAESGDAPKRTRRTKAEMEAARAAEAAAATAPAHRPEVARETAAVVVEAVPAPAPVAPAAPVVPQPTGSTPPWEAAAKTRGAPRLALHTADGGIFSTYATTDGFATKFRELLASATSQEEVESLANNNDGVASDLPQALRQSLYSDIETAFARFGVRNAAE